MHSDSRRRFLQSSAAAVTTALASTQAIGRAADPVGAGISAAVFTADVTPPAGEPLNCGYNPPVKTVEHPLLAKGVVLRVGDNCCAVCAVDWVGLCHEAHLLFRQKIAGAIGTSPDRVAVQTVHQHTAPAIDNRAQQLLAATLGAPTSAGLEFLETAAQRAADAAGHALQNASRVTHVGGTWASVDRVASSRRIRQPDGTILTRFSRATDPELCKAPEGHIDGFLRTVTLYEADSPLARLHYYATHPQSFYGDGRVSYDVPGIARERLEQESGVFQAYFNGCGGDVTMGKYNVGTPEARAALADRLHDAMQRSIAHEHPREAVDSFSWSATPLQLPPRSGADFSEAANRRILSGGEGAAYDRIKAAMILGFIERTRSGPPFDVTCLSLGTLRIVHLPGEPFVDFQLWAQREYRDSFMCVAGYGDCAMWYLGPDAIYTDVGGFEQTWSFADPSEALIRQAIERVITARPA